MSRRQRTLAEMAARAIAAREARTVSKVAVLLDCAPAERRQRMRDAIGGSLQFWSEVLARRLIR